MFRKRKERARDNTEAQVTMEQIRRRMVANVAGSETPAAEAESAIDVVGSDYPMLPKATPSYDSADQHLHQAREIGEIIAEGNRETSSSNGGRSSIGGMLRNSMRWYTAPDEAYWSSALDSMEHILAALKAHDAVVKIHADAIRQVQVHTAALTQQLNEISDLSISHKEAEGEPGES
jgi:hypothetical protein